MLRVPRRPWWQRALALCLAVWFVAVAADLPGLHACAMHGGAPAVAPAAAAAGLSHAGHHDHHRGGHTQVGAAGTAAEVHIDRSHAPGDPDRHACTCLGHCCGAPPVVPPAIAVRPAPEAASAPATVPGRPHHEYVAAWADFVLPFSTAPPAGVTV